MKRLGLLLFAAAFALAAGAAEKRPLRVLMIGNSFSISVLKELPHIVDAQDEYALDITSLYIGGCSLQRHIREYETALADPTHRPYALDRYVTGQGRLKRVRANLIEALDAGSYDVVTIQQASPQSFSPAGWVPWGDRLVAIVREKQPRAKLMLHQTWSYRVDAPRLKKWKLTPEEMFTRVREVYAERARHFGCGVIPMGDAVRLWRSRSGKATPLSVPAAELAKYRPPATPSYKGDVVGSWRWGRRKGDSPRKLQRDAIHLNPDGAYLQGCVWFAVLFGADATKIAYRPAYLTSREAELIRRCAADAVAGKL